MDNCVIPHGYKATALGIIPQEWEVMLLGNLSNSISSGRNKHRDAHGQYPVFGSTGIIGYSSTYEYEGPVILVARVGANAGTLNFASGQYDVSDNTLIITIKQNVYDYNFAYNQLTHYKLNKLVFGSGQPLITSKQLKNIRIPVPPLAEQRKIAEVLGVWDEAIEKQARLIEKLALRKRALMQRLLSAKLRLPGFSEPCKKIKLGDICERVTRKNIEDYQNVMTISAQRGFVAQTDFFNKSVASETLESYYLVFRDEFCYNKSYSNGYPMGAIKRLSEAEKAVVTSLYICFNVKPGTDANIDYLSYYFDNGGLNRGLTKIANEGGRAHGLLNVTPKDFFGLSFEIPSLKEQTAIAKVLTAADREIELAKEKLERLRRQKRGLMQQLLTGKKRVKYGN